MCRIRISERQENCFSVQLWALQELLYAGLYRVVGFTKRTLLADAF